MKKFFFILLFSCGITAAGQGLKKHAAPAVLVFAAGCFEGAMDGLQFHYERPNQFWNPDISYLNKYKGRNPANGKTFAGKYFVTVTDGWHLMKFGRNVTTFAAFTVKLSEKKKWYRYLGEGAAYWLINRVGFNLTYKLF